MAEITVIERDYKTVKAIYVGLPSSAFPYTVHLVDPSTNKRLFTVEGAEVLIADEYNDGVSCKHAMGLNFIETSAAVTVRNKK